MPSKSELEKYLKNKSPFWWNDYSLLVNRENGYVCRVCKKTLVTITRDTGVTPSSMACKATEGCKGLSWSLGYPDPRLKPANLGEPTHEWYRPDSIDDDETELGYFLMDGGLLIRPIDEEQRQPKRQV